MRCETRPSAERVFTDPEAKSDFCHDKLIATTTEINNIIIYIKS